MALVNFLVDARLVLGRDGILGGVVDGLVGRCGLRFRLAARECSHGVAVGLVLGVRFFGLCSNRLDLDRFGFARSGVCNLGVGSRGVGRRGVGRRVGCRCRVGVIGDGRGLVAGRRLQGRRYSSLNHAGCDGGLC